MAPRAKYLNKAAIAHLLRAAAAITGRTDFIIIGTGAVIAQLTSVPLGLMATREIDVYAPDAVDADDISTLIDGTIGEGSPFDAAFGYYAHGVGERTACLPDDWRSRAIPFIIPDAPGVTCLCPEAMGGLGRRRQGRKVSPIFKDHGGVRQPVEFRRDLAQGAVAQPSGRRRSTMAVEAADAAPPSRDS